MSNSTSVPPSVIRPGPSPSGPEGWEEARVEKVTHQQELEKEAQNSKSQSSLKEKLHKVGEKLNLVPADDDGRDRTEKGEIVREAHRQVSERVGGGECWIAEEGLGAVKIGRIWCNGIDV